MEEKFLLEMRKMIKIQKKHKSLIESKTSCFGLHTSHHRALMYLSRKGSLLSQKELAQHLEITPAAVTGILQKLELDGYIERNLGEDNRYNEIKITEEGKNIVDKTRVIFCEIDKSVFESFTEDEMNLLLSFLERISDNMEGEYTNEKMA